jgi:ubiquinone/menaquinone biosynthesis C-methylase UbiE
MQSEALQQHFSRLANQYDKLRYTQELLTPVIETLATVGDLREKRTLDIGCGTGRTLTALTTYYGVQGWGVDVSAEMLAMARAQVPEQITLQQAPAYNLPFSDAFFERVYMTMVVHLLDRPRAFAEIGRVLQPRGRLTIMTPPPAAFERSWLAPLFPSYVKVEQDRFPSGETLAAELIEAGFNNPTITPFNETRTFSKQEALEKIHGRHISTFALFSEEEFQAGAARAERELPEQVHSSQHMIFVSAERV